MTQHAKEPETLGERIKKSREALGFSPENMAHEVKAPIKYIRALEEDDYEPFPAKVYAQGFLKKILSVLALKNPDEFLREFDNEWEVRTFRKKPEATPLPENRGDSPYLTPKRLWFLLGGTALIVLLALAAARLVDFVGKPALGIKEPMNESVVEGPLLNIRGITEKESRLTVNGREIKIDERGNFEEVLELAAGLNTLEFLVKNRFGKENREVRYVLVK